MYGYFGKSEMFTIKHGWSDWGGVVERREQPLSAPAPGKIFGYRNGTNLYVSPPSRANPRPLIQVTETLYKGRKLGYQIWSNRKMKWVWAREPIIVTRMKKAPYKRPIRKPLKGKNLPPNALYTTQGLVEYGPPVVVRNSLSGSAVWTEASGYLWGINFLTWGNTPIGGNCAQYLSAGPSDAYAGIAAELTEELIPKLYEKVKNQDVNLAQALVEYRQSADLFLNTLTRAGKALLALKRGDLVNAFGILLPKTKKELANDWLAFQYGVKPLLSDIDGAAKHLAIPEPRYIDIIVRKKRNSEPYGVPYQDMGNQGLYRFTTTCVAQCEVEVKFKVRLKVSISFGGNLERELSRLGFGNLQALVWESIPYSFIADWVIPIGDYLNNQDAFCGLEVLSVQKTTFVKEVVTVSRTFGGKTEGWETTPAISWFKNTRVKVMREVGLPIPPLPVPEFKNPFSTGHALNAFALFTQLTHR